MNRAESAETEGEDVSGDLLLALEGEHGLRRDARPHSDHEWLLAGGCDRPMVFVGCDREHFDAGDTVLSRPATRFRAPHRPRNAVCRARRVAGPPFITYDMVDPNRKHPKVRCERATVKGASMQRHRRET